MKKCDHDKIYSYQHEAYYCQICDEWAEIACADANCVYCKDRPPRPAKRRPAEENGLD